MVYRGTELVKAVSEQGARVPTSSTAMVTTPWRNRLRRGCSAADQLSAVPACGPAPPFRVRRWREQHR